MEREAEGDPGGSFHRGEAVMARKKGEKAEEKDCRVEVGLTEVEGEILDHIQEIDRLVEELEPIQDEPNHKADQFDIVFRARAIQMAILARPIRRAAVALADEIEPEATEQEGGE